MLDKANAAQKLNTFLYKNKDSHSLLIDICQSKDGSPFERFCLIDIKNRISASLTPMMNRFDGKECIIESSGVSGIIKHKLTRTWENKEIPNETSFRYDESLKAETIALWVETDDKFTSHLYNITDIFLV